MRISNDVESMCRAWQFGHRQGTSSPATSDTSLSFVQAWHWTFIADASPQFRNRLTRELSRSMPTVNPVSVGDVAIRRYKFCIQPDNLGYPRCWKFPPRSRRPDRARRRISATPASGGVEVAEMKAAESTRGELLGERGGARREGLAEGFGRAARCRGGRGRGGRSRRGRGRRGGRGRVEGLELGELGARKGPGAPRRAGRPSAEIFPEVEAPGPRSTFYFPDRGVGLDARTSMKGGDGGSLKAPARSRRPDSQRSALPPCQDAAQLRSALA